MKALRNLRAVLKTLAQEVEVLSAVGGAVEDLDRPDVEEREDQALNQDERVFDTVFERDQALPYPPLYRPTPPLCRPEKHLFRHFLDGSFRSYFLGTMLERERETPVHFAQIGACLLRRLDDGTVRREALEVRYLLMAGRLRLSDEVWQDMQRLTTGNGITLVDLSEQDIGTRVMSDTDLRNNAAGKVRFRMHLLEVDMIARVFDSLSADDLLLVDGSMLFQQNLAYLSQKGEIPPVLGVAKNFRKDPRFVYGRGPRAERRSIYKLLSELEVAHRTAAYSAMQGKVAFWYVRLREQRHLDYPMMGVIKVELVNPTQEPVPSELLDELSRALVAERSVTPHGQDRRWHVHLYPIFLAERAVKESLLGRDVVQQYLKWS